MLTPESPIRHRNHLRLALLDVGRGFRSAYGTPLQCRRCSSVEPDGSVVPGTSRRCPQSVPSSLPMDWAFGSARRVRDAPRLHQSQNTDLRDPPLRVRVTPPANIADKVTAMLGGKTLICWAHSDVPGPRPGCAARLAGLRLLHPAAAPGHGRDLGRRPGGESSQPRAGASQPGIPALLTGSGCI